MTLRLTSFVQGGPPQDGECDVQAGGTIELYFYGELTPGARDVIEQHLAGCALCRQSLQELTQIRAALAARPVVDGPRPATGRRSCRDWRRPSTPPAPPVSYRSCRAPG